MRARKNLPPRRDTEENRTLAFNYSIKYLSQRAHSIKEVFDYLTRKNFVEDTVNHVLKRLVDSKFINDEEFGRAWIELRQKYKNKSKFILKNELRLKGLDGSTIDKLLNDATEDFETAKILFQQRKERLKGLTPQEFRNKMGAFLQRRGFSYDVISKLLKGN